MSFSVCSACLGRSLRTAESALPPNAIRAATFSTSSALAALPPPVKVSRFQEKRMTPKIRNKTKRVATGKPPAIGERKAARKKVVLNNPNALEVPGLPELTNRWTSQDLRAMQGTVAALSEASVSAVRALEGFQPTQGWALFRRPATLVRQETVELAQTLEMCADEAKAVRRVICGERGSGKSVLQLQALTLAQLKGWLVVHIPDAKELVNAHTAYVPEETRDGRTIYIQPNAVASLLQNIVNANRSLLSKLQLRHKHTLPLPVQENISLDRFAELGAQDPTIAWPIWQVFWREMLSLDPSRSTSIYTPSPSPPSHARPPVLFSLDSIQHIMRPSAYLSPSLQPIHAHDLALVENFTRLLSGATTLPNGGLVLASTTRSNIPSAPVLDHMLHVRMFQARRAAGEIPKNVPNPKWDPYLPFDSRVDVTMRNVEVREVKGLSKSEARGVIEYYARSGMMRDAITQTLVNETWTIAGGGIVGQIERASVRTRF